MAEAMTIQTQKNSIDHWVLYPLLIVILEPILQWFSSTPMLMISAIRHYNNIIHSKHAPQKLNWARVQLWQYKMKTATAKVGGIMQNIERERVYFHEKYSEVCITRAAVNKIVCEDWAHVDCRCSGFFYFLASW